VDTGGELVRAPEDGGREVEAEPDLLIVAPVALGELLEERKLDRGVLGRGGGVPTEVPPPAGKAPRAEGVPFGALAAVAGAALVAVGLLVLMLFDA
jgi:hypothetical protein